MQIAPEVSPVVESQSNGEVESAVKQVQWRFRTIRSHVQSKYNRVIAENSELLAWLVPYDAHSSNRYLVAADGRPPRQRLKGRSFK